MPEPEVFARRHNFQTLSWLVDFYKRGRLDMDPAYQRRSVWSPRYKRDFIDTVLLGFPCPSIFLFEERDADGQSRYAVIDGKQRLSTMFQFIENEIAVGETSPYETLRGKYFDDLGEVRDRVWGYQFTIEYVPSANVAIIDQIFDRINRNVAKLTAQELRHAKYDGVFIRACEELAAEMDDRLGDLPHLAASSRRQMKDVEVVASLLLLVESGPRGYSTDEMDFAFGDRDEDWPGEQAHCREFRNAVGVIAAIEEAADGVIKNTRLRNQADFYSLFGAITTCPANELPDPATMAERLQAFVALVNDSDRRDGDARATEYYRYARSASNDTGPRQGRTAILRDVILGR